MVGNVILLARAAPVDLSIAVARTPQVAGSAVDIEVEIHALGDLEVSGIEVAAVAEMRFIYQEAGMFGPATMGRAKRTEIHDRRAVPGPWPLSAGESITLPARLQLPEDAPGTTRTDLIEIRWNVRVRLEAVGYTYAEALREVVVLTTAANLAHVAIRPPAGDSRGTAQLAFDEVSSRFLVPGRAVSGTLVITPLRAAVVRSARVAILLRQRVARGEWVQARSEAYQPIERSTQIVSRTLAEGLELTLETCARLPFTLPVRPALPASTIDTPAFSARWMLRAELDRGLRRAPYTEVELHGRTVRQ